MKVIFHFHGVLQRELKQDRFALRLSSPQSLGEILKTLSRELPQITPHLAHLAFAREDQVIYPHVVLQDGDEIHCLPPVSGG